MATDTPTPPFDAALAADTLVSADGVISAEVGGCGVEHMITPHRGMTLTAIRRGATRRCPCCGAPGLFTGYLRVAPHCAACGLPTGSFRADDAPPYLTILVVAHLVVTAALALEQAAHPPLWVHMALWLPLTLALSLVLLPVFKGVVIGIQWAMGIRG